MKQATLKQPGVLYIQRKYLVAIPALIAVFLLAGGVSHRVQAIQEARSCAGLRAQGLDPQKVFDSDPVKYKRLDRDGDLKACE